MTALRAGAKAALVRRGLARFDPKSGKPGRETFLPLDPGLRDADTADNAGQHLDYIPGRSVTYSASGDASSAASEAAADRRLTLAEVLAELPAPVGALLRERGVEPLTEAIVRLYTTRRRALGRGLPPRTPSADTDPAGVASERR